MKFKRVLRESLRFWPGQVQISDGKLQAGGGGYFPTLSRAWDAAEKYADAWSEAHQLMVWAIFCALHERAVASLPEGHTLIAKSDIDFRYLRQRYEESLFAVGSGYPRRMRREYVRELATRQKPILSLLLKT